MECLKKKYHVTAYVEDEEVNFSCSSERSVAIRFLNVILTHPSITSVVFEEVMFDEFD